MDQDQRGDGKLRIIAVKDGQEGRHDLHHQHHHDSHCDKQHKNRVGQGGLDPRRHLGLLVKMLVHGLEGLVQVAALLAGGNGLHEGRRQELFTALGKACRDGTACLHILRHVHQHTLERLVRGLVGNQMAGARDGNARAQDDGKLAAHDDEGLVVELVAPDLHVEQTVFLDRGHLDDHAVVLLDAVHGVHLVEGVDHAGYLLPALRQGRIFIGYQMLSLPFGNACG